MSAHAEPIGPREPYGGCSLAGDPVAYIRRETGLTEGWEQRMGGASLNPFDVDVVLAAAATMCDCREGWPVEADEPEPDENPTHNPGLADREPWSGGFARNH